MPQPIRGSQRSALCYLSSLYIHMGAEAQTRATRCCPAISLPPLPGQQNGSQGAFVALSQSSLCEGPSVSLSFMDKRVHPGCVCVWVFKSRRGVAASRTWDKVTESSLLSGKLVGRKAVALGLRSGAYRIQHFGAECQLQLAREEGLFPVFESAVLEGSWGHSFYSQ